MNIKSLVASALIAGSSLLSAIPAEARTPWIYIGTGVNTGRQFVRDITSGSNGFKYYYDDDNNKNAMNCRTGEGWWFSPYSKEWKSMGYYKPGSMAEAEYEVVCLGYRPSIY